MPHRLRFQDQFGFCDEEKAIVSEEIPEFEVDDAIVLLLGSPALGSENQGEIRGITRLEKLVFLLEQETAASGHLTEDADFEPYNFGPFSRKVYQAIDTLSAAGLVVDSARLSTSSDDTWEEERVIGNDAGLTPYTTRDFKLTPLGVEYYAALKSELPGEVVSGAETLRAKFAGWSLRALVRYVYEKYERYTENSLIRDDILGKGGGS